MVAIVVKLLPLVQNIRIPRRRGRGAVCKIIKTSLQTSLLRGERL